MVCKCGTGKTGTTISVFVLGFALLSICLTYLVFGESNDVEARTTLELASIVSFFGVSLLKY